MFDSFIKVREMGYEPICVVGGKDDDENRAEGYKQILDKYFNDGKTSNEINENEINENSVDNVSDKKETLYKYMTSNEFKQKWEAIVGTYINMQKQ